MNVLKVRPVALAMFCACLSVPVAGQLRQQSFLSEKWDFRLDKDGREDVWEQVDVPHTWNAKDGTSPDYYRGDGTYRYTLSVSPAMMKKRIFLRFEAASQKAEVKLNGQEVGEHVGGFNAFCFEITPYVHSGENLLEVIVSNRKELNIAPLEGDFTVFGGIYRPVSLLLLPKACITPLDYASSGVYVSQQVGERRADLSVVTKVDNGLKRVKELSVKTDVFDAAGKLVATATTSQATEGQARLDFTNRLTVDNPMLWDGRKSPYLYRVFVELKRGKEVLDTLSQYVGLRSFRVDAEKGFILNGKPYKIKGGYLFGRPPGGHVAHQGNRCQRHPAGTLSAFGRVLHLVRPRGHVGLGRDSFGRQSLGHPGIHGEHENGIDGTHPAEFQSPFHFLLEPVQRVVQRGCERIDFGTQQRVAPRRPGTADGVGRKCGEASGKRRTRHHGVQHLSRMVLGGAFGNEIHFGAVEPPVWEQGYRRERVWSRRKRVASLADGKEDAEGRRGVPSRRMAGHGARTDLRCHQAQRFRVGFFRLEHVRFCQRVAQRGRYAGDERQGAGLLRP